MAGVCEAPSVKGKALRGVYRKNWLPRGGMNSRTRSLAPCLCHGATRRNEFCKLLFARQPGRDAQTARAPRTVAPSCRLHNRRSALPAPTPFPPLTLSSIATPPTATPASKPPASASARTRPLLLRPHPAITSAAPLPPHHLHPRLPLHLPLHFPRIQPLLTALTLPPSYRRHTHPSTPSSTTWFAGNLVSTPTTAPLP